DATQRREVKTVGFLGVSDYGLGQLEVLAGRYKVAFATAKQGSAAHASGLDLKLANICTERGIEYLGSVDANTSEMVALARKTDLVIIGGYDGILKRDFIEASRYGVINTHLGMLPLNRGCFPTLWAQLHKLPQGYTTYQVGTAVDFGAVLELYYRAEDDLGCLRDTNRFVYDELAAKAVANFSATLDRFEAGEALAPCAGREAYHKKGLPNDGWISFRWSNVFLRRFSLALDFAPYLPGRARLVSATEDGAAELSLSIEDTDSSPGAGSRPGKVGEVLEVFAAEEFLVRTREGTARCRLRKGNMPTPGSILAGDEAAACAHPVDADFAGEELPLDRYLVVRKAVQS
ncbi:unnamed protein product, partial [Polarella glacialis]